MVQSLASHLLVNGTTELPNPFTPMAFLTPKAAYQSTIQTYILVAAVGILVWDILEHVPSDYRMLFKQKFSLPTLIYFCSRLGTLSYCISSLVFETAPIGNCVKLSKIPCTIYHFAVSSSALLFFFRVRAVYGNKYITAVFFVLWLAVLGGSLTIINGITGAHIGTSEYCTTVQTSSYTSSSFITAFVFDTAVFMAISWRLLSDAPTVPGQDKPRLWFIIPSRYIPSFSRGFVQDGQKYYLVAFVSNFLVLIMVYVRGAPAGWFTNPTVALTNIMACRVFRNTKFGHYHVSQEPAMSLVFQHSSSGNHVPISFSTRSQQQTGTLPVNITNSTIDPGDDAIASLEKKQTREDSVV